MTKLFFPFAAGAAVLLISCEPLPPNPPSGYRPQAQNYPRGDDRNPRDPYVRQDPRRNNPDNRYGPGIIDPPGGDRFERPPTREQYPTAERTDNPNQVISPYAPDYNVIDVEGFRSGQLAKDPSNGKIFRVP